MGGEGGCSSGCGGGGTGAGGDAYQAGNVPGGGGGSDPGTTGARGEIRIHYTCSNDPGTITNAHTVTYPRELDNDFIANNSYAGGYGLTYYWLQSTDGVNFSYVNNYESYYYFPEISTTHWYRRDNNGCGSNISSNVIKIKVIPLNGVISGRITSTNGSNVEGDSISVQKVGSLPGSPQSKIYYGKTGPDGTYSIPVYYGDKDEGTNNGSISTQFVVKPIRFLHDFDNASLNKTLTNITPTVTADFKDLTIFSIVGRVTQTCPDCFYPSVIAGVGGAKITVSPSPVPGYTDSVNAGSIGNYSTTVSDPKQYTFTPSYRNHTFTPVSNTKFISDKVTTIDFADNTTHTISGKLADGGGLYIGDALLVFTGSFVTKDGAIVPTFTKKVTLTSSPGDSGKYTVTLPAGSNYKVSIESFTDAYPGTDRSVAEGELKDFFNTKGIEAPIDINEADVVRNLVYHRPPVVEITGLTDTTCNADLGIVFKQNVRKYFQANVFEGPSSLGHRVVPTDSTIKAGPGKTDTLGDYMRFLTNVTDVTGKASPDTLRFRLYNRQTKDMIDSFFLPGAPYITPPYNKTFEIHYIDRYGRKITPIIRKAVGTGVQSPPSTFITTSPQKPYLILHEPPGDQSYSYWSSTESVETSSKFSVAKSNGEDGFEEINAGAEFSTGIGVQIETEIVGSINKSKSYTATNTPENEFIFNTSTTNSFQTVKGGSIIQRSSGDVYVGAALNMKIGAANTVFFVKTVPPGCNCTCALDFERRLIAAPDSFKTEFAYAEDHIKNVIIPLNQSLADQETNEAKKAQYLDQISVWSQVIENNDNNKKTASFKLNKSFSSGLTWDESLTSTNTNVNTLTYEVEIDGNLAKNWELP